MPDDYNNVGSAAPAVSSTREVQLKINHGDPDLAVTEQGALVASPPEVQAPPPPRPQPLRQPLSETAAPFNVPDSRLPATEYVNLNPTPIPRPVPHPVQRPIPKPQPLFQPAPKPVIAQPIPQPIPAPQQFAMGQAIGPIIRKRPPVGRPMKVLQPFSAPLVATASASPQAMPPSPMPPPQPATPAVPPPPIPAAAPQPAKPAPVTLAPVAVPGSTIVGRPLAPEPSADIAQASRVNIDGSVVRTPSVDYSKPLMAYSDNTRAVWQVRRSGKTLLITFAIGLCLVLFGMLVYWKSIGSPTNIQDIPLLHLH